MAQVNKIKQPFDAMELSKTLITFKGEAEWCKYIPKNMEKGQFAPDGQYSVNLLANPEAEDYKLFVGKLQAMADKAMEDALDDSKGDLVLTPSKKKSLQVIIPLKEHIIKEKDSDGNYTIEVETGKMVYVPKMKNVLKKPPEKQIINLIGADGNPVPLNDRPEIGNGSIIQCQVFIKPFYMASSNTIYLTNLWKAVRIIEMKEYSRSGGSDVEDFDVDDEVFTPTHKEETFSDEGDF